MEFRVLSLFQDADAQLERQSMIDDVINNLQQEYGSTGDSHEYLMVSKSFLIYQSSSQNKDDKLPKRSETKKQEGSRKRGRPQLRWEDCVKRDLRKAEEEEKWREKANNRDPWKQITKVAVIRSDQ